MVKPGLPYLDIVRKTKDKVCIKHQMTLYKNLLIVKTSNKIEPTTYILLNHSQRSLVSGLTIGKPIPRNSTCHPYSSGRSRS